MIDLKKQLSEFDIDFKELSAEFPIRGKGNYNKLKAQAKKYISDNVKEINLVNKLIKGIETKHSDYSLYFLFGRNGNGIYKGFEVNSDLTLYVSIHITNYEGKVNMYSESEFVEFSDDYQKYLSTFSLS